MKLIYSWMLVTFFVMSSCTSSKLIYYCVDTSNSDLCSQLRNEGFYVKKYATVEDAVNSIPKNGKLLLLASDYPIKGVGYSNDLQAKALEKNLRVYWEYPSWDEKDSLAMPIKMGLERAVVYKHLNNNLKNNNLLSFNNCYVLPQSDADSLLLVMSKVAGFDRATFGLDNTKYYPLLYTKGENLLVCNSRISHFAKARYMPNHRVKNLLEYIVSWLNNDGMKVAFTSWINNVKPQYSETEDLPFDAKIIAVNKGIQWFYNARLLVHKDWKKSWVDKYMGDGSCVVGPELSRQLPVGDGSLGVLEGHLSGVAWDGKQDYRYWMRDDVQGESAYAFSIASKLLKNKDYEHVAGNLIDYSFKEYQDGARSNPNSPSFGLLGWAYTHKHIYYGDDNARSILGSIATAAMLNEKKWNKDIVECIYGNFRTTGKNGFRGERLEEKDLQTRGWKSYFDSNLINPHPHFESWNWACYLWLYSKTGYKPLLDRVKLGVKITMESYPDKWKWTNGIQQEKARMLLPLAWLVRVDPSEQNIKWLRFMTDEVLKNQVKSGGIREELGDEKSGMFGSTKSNEDYGKHEAPLISVNGDPVCDMLYTTNFAFVGLYECAIVTKDLRYMDAVNKMSDFLCRIQVNSEKNKGLDGAWFRAFNYQCWDYWASNADAGWGAWSTLTGWIQSWIVATQGLMELKTSLWDLASDLDLNNEADSVIESMNKF